MTPKTAEAAAEAIANGLRQAIAARDAATVANTIRALHAAGYALHGAGYAQAIADATVRALDEAGWLKSSTAPTPIPVVVVEMPRRRHTATRDTAGKVVGSIEEDDL